ncbi:MAG: phosphopantothenoylcysteine decarboxylase [Bacteroidota bacterium]
MGNYSSGKMGYAIAETCAELGANVILISGPVSLSAKHPNIHLVSVNRAGEMFDKCHEYFPQASITILSAAVADYTPEVKIETKIKRKKEAFLLKLMPTQDIAASLGKIKRKDQLLIGFALETHDEEENARLKLKKKNFDFIVLNSLRDKGAGFQTPTNKITLIDKSNNIDKFELKSKKEVAEDIIKKIISLKDYD